MTSTSSRILFLATPDCDVLSVIDDLTSSTLRSSNLDTIAGLTHEWKAETQYYSLTIPIWVDEVTNINKWKTEFIKAEAKEVVEAVGAWIYCYRQSGSKDVEAVLQACNTIDAVINEHLGWSGEAVMLAVAIPQSSNSPKMDRELRDKLEDATIDSGFEFIDYAATETINGQTEGKARLKEALEAHDWSQQDDVDDEDPLEAEDFDQLAKEDIDSAAELSALKQALLEGNTADTTVTDDIQPADVDDLDVMLGRLLAVKEQSADLPMAQRKRLAAKAVRDLMKQNDT